MPSVPDYRAAAEAEAAQINADPAILRAPIERTLSDCPHANEADLLAGLEAFHRERMAKRPPAADYPEAQPWVDFTFKRDALLQELTGIDDAQLALRRSLGPYLCFRGFLQMGPVNGGRVATTERCRVVYLPESDRGQFHIKNVDDPLTHYTPRPMPTEPPFAGPLIWDGVGNGMFIDDEPEQIFPLPIREMWLAHCADVPGSIEFLTRYSPFIAGMNMVIHDLEGNAVAIEKPSHNFIETFGPEASGGFHVSGNVTRDPESPQGRYFRQKREQYCQLVNMPGDAPDRQFWANCERAEHMLSDLLAKPGPLATQDVIDLFITPWPDGLNKDGVRMHPDQTAAPEYTLTTHIGFLDERLSMRYQRDTQGNWPKEPEVLRY